MVVLGCVGDFFVAVDLGAFLKVSVFSEVETNWLFLSLGPVKKAVASF